MTTDIDPCPMNEWTDYAKRSGLLDAEGVAPDRFAANTAFSAFAAGWNRRAALSSPPVLPAEPVAYVIDWQDIGEGAAQSFYYGLGAKENMQAAINYAASIPRSAKVTPLTPYAAPQSAAPALDDARDAARWRFVRSPQISTSEHKALIEAISSDEGEHLDAAIDALMQQEPRS